MFFLSGLSCSPADNNIFTVDESTNNQLIASFIHEAGQDASKFISQTVQITIRDPKVPTTLYRASALIIDDHTLITSAHTFSRFYVKVNDFAWKPAFDFFEIIISDAWGKVIYNTITNFTSFLNGMNLSIAAFSAADIFQLTHGDTFDFMNHDFAIVKLREAKFSMLTGEVITPIKPEVRFPEPNTKFYTLGYAQASSNLQMHATVFETDNEFSIRNSDQINVFKRTTRRSPGTVHNTFGDSGGPLIWMDKNNKPHLLGIVTAGKLRDNYIENYFTSFADVKIISLLYDQNIKTIPDFSCTSTKNHAQH